MKVLVLTKRQYMGKDLLNDHFGRFRELPLELAKLGHDVMGICLSYRPRDEGITTDTGPTSEAHVTWHSLNLGGLIIPGLIRYLAEANSLARGFKPDLIWACSDSFHAIFGLWLARRLKAKCFNDLYDNFEGFAATRLPGVLPLFKRAVKAADGVTCFSQRLADRIIQNYQRSGPVTVLESGVRVDAFHPKEQTACRRRLGLPENAKIIGTAGALYRKRGIHTLFRGFELLADEEENIHLLVAGPRGWRSGIPRGPRVHDLGILPWEEVPVLINALDVAVICYRDSLVGRTSFPQKAYEIMACRTPLVAAAVGTMKDILDKHPECLFEPENPHSFAKAVRSQLMKPTMLEIDVPSWADLAKQLEAFFVEASSIKDAG